MTGPVPGARQARRIRPYLMGALDLIRRTALFSETVDWGAVYGDAEVVLREADCYADTHGLLATVLGRAGGRHSSLRTPQHVREIRDRAAAALGPAVPAGQVIDGAGYLRLPRLPGGRRLAARYVTVGGWAARRHGGGTATRVDRGPDRQRRRKHVADASGRGSTAG